jgi:hypothetical protein
MLAIYKSDKKNYKGVLVDLVNKKIVAYLTNLTQGWAIGTDYKKKHNLRCPTDNRSKILFEGFDAIDSTDSGGYDSENAGRRSVVSKYNVATRFEFMEELIAQVINSVHPAIIITGPGGVGKSKTVFDAVHNSNLTPGTYKVLKGFTTPLGLYRTLSENRHSLLIFDDCDSAFQDETAINLLKAVLDSTDRRIVSWNSSRLPDDLDPEFEFKGRIIFISNVPLNKFDDTIISRSYVIDLQLSREEIVDRIEQLKLKIAPCTPAEAEQVMEFFKEFQDNLVDLNLRTYLKVLKLKLSGSPKWKEMSEYMFCK